MTQFRDILGNEIRKGDTLLYFTGSGSSIFSNIKTVVGFEPGKDKIMMQETPNSRVSRIQRYRMSIVINDTDRHLHEKDPGLGKLWKKYLTYRTMTT